MAGCDALLSTIGGAPSRGATDLYSQGVANELQAMAANKITILQVVSAAPAGPLQEQPLAARQIMFPVLWRFFGNQYEDMRRMEAVPRSSTVDWIVLRPPRLVSKSATGNYRVDTKPLDRTRRITYPDLAWVPIADIEPLHIALCWRRGDDSALVSSFARVTRDLAAAAAAA